MTVGSALEEAEDQTLHLHSPEYHLPLVICEEPMDLSFINTSHAEDLSYATCCTNVGGVLQALGRQTDDYMLAELCGDDDPEEIGASIFDHNSSMGLELGESLGDEGRVGNPTGLSDHWLRDESLATWTRMVMVPRTAHCFLTREKEVQMSPP